MKKHCGNLLGRPSALLFLIIALIWAASGISRTPAVPDRRDAVTSRDQLPHGAAISEAYGRIPLHFEANRGQTDNRVKFLARGHGYTMFLTATDVR